MIICNTEDTSRSKGKDCPLSLDTIPFHFPLLATWTDSQWQKLNTYFICIYYPYWICNRVVTVMFVTFKIFSYLKFVILHFICALCWNVNFWTVKWSFPLFCLLQLSAVNLFSKKMSSCCKWPHTNNQKHNCPIFSIVVPVWLCNSDAYTHGV